MTPTRGRRDGRAVRILAFAAAISLYGIRRADVQTTSARKDYGGRWLRHDRWDDDDGGEYEVVTTDYGWNSPTVSPPTRRILTGEFYRAILEHPRYNATAWSDLHEHPDPSRRVVAFMDVDTCMESNYPTYGVKWTHDNVNLEINAIPGERIQRSLRYACGHVRRAFESPALSANPDSRLVILDCGTGYPGSWIKDLCDNSTNPDSNKKFGGGWVGNRGDPLQSAQLVIAYFGITKDEARATDIGLPAPAIKPVELGVHERYAVENCERLVGDGRSDLSRHLALSFRGGGDYGRDRLLQHHNGDDVSIEIKRRDDQRLEREMYGYVNSTAPNDYGDVLRDSWFSAAPHGDCLWSYRFTEILSAGAVS